MAKKKDDTAVLKAGSYIKHNNTEYPIPEGSTVKETFESLKMAVPELANAKLQKDGDNWIAKTSFGKKG